MSRITGAQANELAMTYASFSQTIGAYRIAHWTELSTARAQRLADAQWSLLNYAEDLVLLANRTIAMEIGQAVATLQDINTRIASDIEQLENIQQVIDVAASLVVLGAAFLSANPTSIVEALDGVLDQLNG